jgi:hypothetical protein
MIYRSALHASYLAKIPDEEQDQETYQAHIVLGHSFHVICTAKVSETKSCSISEFL